MYRFELHYPGTRDAMPSSLSQALHHAPMGASALDWSVLIHRTCLENPEILIHGIYRDGTCLGIATTLVVNGLDPAKYLPGPLASLLKLCFRFNIGFLEVPLMNLPGILTVEGIDGIERGAILHQLRQHLRDTLKLDALLIKTDGSILSSREHPCFANTVPLAFLPNAILELPYNDMAAYWSDRPRKKYRKFSTESRTLQKYNGKIQIQPKISNLSERAFSLYQNTISAARQKSSHIQMPLSVGVDFFSQIFQFDGLNPRLITVEIDDNVVASALVFSSGDALYLKAIGLDYELSYDSRAYFHLFYALLDYAIRENYKCIDLGITSYRFKQWLGCELHSTAYACDVYNPVLHHISRHLTGILERGMGFQCQNNPALDTLRP